MAKIKIIKPGMFTSIQDQGRYGFRRYGIPLSGVMDGYASQLANLLVGNPLFYPLFEITIIGPVMEFDGSSLIAVCGADMQPKLNGQAVAMFESFVVRKGDVLSFGKLKNGCRAYIAVKGGIQLDQFMGSYSTYLPAKMGGLNGRLLEKDDELSYRSVFRTPKVKKLPEHYLPNYDRGRKVRVIKGPEWTQVDGQIGVNLLTTSFVVSVDSDRMGIRLEGLEIEDEKINGILSSPVSIGTIQFPAGSKPIIIMSDGQTTGGYARIANIISVDIPYVAQQKPGDPIDFKLTSLEDARHLFLYRKKKLELLLK